MFSRLPSVFSNLISMSSAEAEPYLVDFLTTTNQLMCGHVLYYKGHEHVDPITLGDRFVPNGPLRGSLYSFQAVLFGADACIAVTRVPFML